MRLGGPSRLRLEAGRALSARPTWWVTFVLMGSLFASWSLASPLWSVPDEGAHTVNAAAVVRGQVGGQDRVVKVPGFYAPTDAKYLPCYAFHPDETANCVPYVRGPAGDADASTQFDRYPPLPYALLGLPSLLPPSNTVVHLMRLMSALACAALVASGLVSAASLGRGMTVAATLFAVTPMAAFLAGSVNTSGIEIAAAICLWPSLLALARQGPGAPVRLIERTAVAAGVLASSRPISTLWLVIIAAIVALAVGWVRVRGLARDPKVVRAAIVVAVVTTLTVAWVVLLHSLAGIAGGGQSHGLAADLRFSIGKFPELVRQMIGDEGWLDTPPPFLLVFAWTVALGGLLWFGFVAGAPRGLLALVTTAGLVIAIPVAIETARAATSGFPWQGRYTLPLAIGVPVLCGWLVDTGTPALHVFVRSAARAVIVVACGVQVLAQFWSTRRYVSGVHGSIFYVADSGWHAPVPTWLLLVTVAAASTAIGVWIDRMVGAAGASERSALADAPAAAGGHSGHNRNEDGS